jgi:hypothetical protein
MRPQSLHIGEHIKELVLKALNRTKFEIEAARLLGVTPKTLRRYKRQLKVVKVDGVFISRMNHRPHSFTFYCNKKRVLCNL